MLTFLKNLTRRQRNGTRRDIRFNQVEASNESNADGSLNRELNLMSLVFLNVSNSIGSGIYVLTGMVANLYSGPFTCVSYLFAGLVCLLSAFCFAEFASRVKSSSGSSYSFVYYSVGEFPAYLIGWMIFTGSVTSIAATALTWSSYFDTLTDHVVSNFTINVLHAKWDLKTPFNNQLDLMACLITLVFFLICLRGVHVTSVFNNTFAILNLSLMVCIFAGGVVFGKLSNLTETAYTNGVNGVVTGASIVMYAYIGFESSTYAIDETLNPTRNVPASLVISIIVIIISYCGSSLSLNLMQTYDKIDPHTSYPTAFKDIQFLYLIVSFGPLISLSGSLITSVYSTVRIVHNMSRDGLLFKALSRISESTHVPHVSTLFTLVTSLILIVVIDVKNLVGFTDITGFLTYSFISFSLLVTRYYNGDDDDVYDGHQKPRGSASNENQNLVESSIDSPNEQLIDDRENETQSQELGSNAGELFNPPVETQLTLIKKLRKKKFFRLRDNCLFLIVFIYVSNMAYFFLLHYFKIIKLFLICLIVISNLICTLLLSIFPQANSSSDSISFKVPFVPLIPVLVIVANTYLLMASDAMEWIVFSVILTLGLPVYFFYGYRHSRLNGLNQL